MMSVHGEEGHCTEETRVENKQRAANLVLSELQHVLQQHENVVAQRWILRTRREELNQMIEVRERLSIQ